ncbi:element excision factor XisH family protein [Nostoc sp.]
MWVSYLAVPLVNYNDFFNLSFIQTVVNKNKLKLIIYNVETEGIEQWTN